MIFDALGSLALGEIPITATPPTPPTPTPTPEAFRISGGKLIAAFTMDDNGRLRRDMDAFIEKSNQEDDAIMTALLAYWRQRDN